MPNLVIQTAYLGDLLLSLSLIRNIRKAFHSQPLNVLCRHGFGDLIRDLQVCDEVFEVNKNSKQNISKVKYQLRQKRFDYVFSPHESFRTALFVRTLHANHKVGFWHWWNKFAFNVRVKKPFQLPDALRQLSLLEPLGRFDRHDLEVFINSNQKNTTYFSDLMIPADLSLQDHLSSPILREPTVLLAPGSVWPTKRWTEQGFKEIGQRFRKNGYQVITIGSPNEVGLCAEISAHIDGCQNLAGRLTLSELKNLMFKAQLLITNDSGAMHLAALAGLSTVAVFGATTLDLGYRPWIKNSVVVQKDLTCRPCGPHGAQRCPLGTHACMKNVSANDVWIAANHLLQV